eukprot:822918_1
MPADDDDDDDKQMDPDDGEQSIQTVYTSAESDDDAVLVSLLVTEGNKERALELEAQEQIKDWLGEEFGLNVYCRKFLAYGYDTMDHIKDIIDEQALVDIEINSQDHRNKIMIKINKLKIQNNEHNDEDEDTNAMVHCAVEWNAEQLLHRILKLEGGGYEPFKDQLDWILIKQQISRFSQYWERNRRIWM